MNRAVSGKTSHMSNIQDRAPRLLIPVRKGHGDTLLSLDIGTIISQEQVMISAVEARIENACIPIAFSGGEGAITNHIEACSEFGIGLIIARWAVSESPALRDFAG